MDTKVLQEMENQGQLIGGERPVHASAETGSQDQHWRVFVCTMHYTTFNNFLSNSI